MVWTVIQREILRNLMTFRFFVAVITCISLVIIGTVVLTDNYERRLSSYNTDFQTHQEITFVSKTYSTFRSIIDRPPNSLSLYNQGLDKRVVNSIRVRIGEVPSLWNDVYQHQINKEYLNAQIYQVRVARDYNRLSPAAILQYAIESLAGTGFQRYLNFMKNAENYEVEFNNFLISTDRGDPDSLQAPFVKEGMSNKPVPFVNIPKFQDRVQLGNAFKGAILDAMLLFLFFVVIFTTTHVTFQRKEI